MAAKKPSNAPKSHTKAELARERTVLQATSFPLGLWALGLTLLLLFVLLWSVVRLSGVMMPFMIGFVLAYLLQPAVRALSKRGLPKPLAVSVCVLLFLTFLFGLLLLGGPLLIEQLRGFVVRAPTYAHMFQDELVPELQARLSDLFGDNFSDNALATLTEGYSDRIATLGVTVSQAILGGVSNVMGVLGLLIFAPVVAFYLLLDWRQILDNVVKVLPRPWQPEIARVSHNINVKLAAYLRGQITVCVLLGIYYGSLLTAMGLELGWAIGFATGLLGFIPIVGTIIGFSMMMGMALVQFQFDVTWPYIVIAVIFGVGQCLENYVLTPQLVGRGVGLHPLWVMFALLAGGSLAGLLGMLIALPMAIVATEVVPPVLNAWRRAVEED